MFWKKKNLQLIFEVMPDGQYIIKCKSSKHFNPEILFQLLIALWNKRPKLAYSICESIKYWGDKDGWAEEAKIILQAIIEEESRIINDAMDRHPIVLPTKVLDNFRKSVNIKE